MTVITEERTSTAADALVEPRDRPLGATATFAEFGGTTDGDDVELPNGGRYTFVDQDFAGFAVMVLYSAQVEQYLGEEALYAHTMIATTEEGEPSEIWVGYNPDHDPRGGRASDAVYIRIR